MCAWQLYQVEELRLKNPCSFNNWLTGSYFCSVAGYDMLASFIALIKIRTDTYVYNNCLQILLHNNYDKNELLEYLLKFYCEQ